jgi:hypothetical protein
MKWLPPMMAIRKIALLTGAQNPVRREHFLDADRIQRRRVRESPSRIPFRIMLGRLHQIIVTVRPIDTDRYGRTVAEVVLPDGRSLNHELVRGGMAWWFRKYAPDDRELGDRPPNAGEMCCKSFPYWSP